MDLDRDGRLDVISGSYPGELYVFQGQEDGTYAEAKRIVDAGGDEINLGSAAAVFASDWDRDGDLDLVVGDIRGHVWFVPNESGGAALELGAARRLEVDGDVISVAHGDAGPMIADWDGSGTLDLIVGCGDGSVLWYANSAKEGPPVLAGPTPLLESSGNGMHLEPDAPIRVGSRVKPCVFDFDGDGRLDLLVGDVILRATARAARTDEDTARLERLRRKRDLVARRYQPAMARVRRQALTELGVEQDGEDLTKAWAELDEEQRDRFGETFAAALKKDIEAAALARMVASLSSEIRALEPRSGVHGHVWLLLRQ